MVSKKELWKIEGYQFVKQWSESFGDIKTFEHFCWSMDFETAKKYINNMFEDIHKQVVSNE